MGVGVDLRGAPQAARATELIELKAKAAEAEKAKDEAAAEIARATEMAELKAQLAQAEKDKVAAEAATLICCDSMYSSSSTKESPVDGTPVVLASGSGASISGRSRTSFVTTNT